MWIKKSTRDIDWNSSGAKIFGEEWRISPNQPYCAKTFKSTKLLKIFFERGDGGRDEVNDINNNNKNLQTQLLARVGTTPHEKRKSRTTSCTEGLTNFTVLRCNQRIVDVLWVWIALPSCLPQQDFNTFGVLAVLSLLFLVTLCTLTRVAPEFSHNSGSRWFSP